MKPVEELFGVLDAPRLRGRGWSVFVDALSVPAWIGIHPHEHEAPQPIVIDARLGYRCAPDEANAWIDYDGYCARIAAFRRSRTMQAGVPQRVAGMLSDAMNGTLAALPVVTEC